VDVVVQEGELLDVQHALQADGVGDAAEGGRGVLEKETHPTAGKRTGTPGPADRRSQSV
jgi:hypothetical protein